ncbi:MAG: adenylate/guanylate cyclase domain-containing protein [Actinomycetota bacterium]
MIRVFLADDNLLMREGVKALIQLAGDLELVGEAEDYDSLVAGAGEAAPHVVVTDIRMPPHFSREGIDAAAEIRRRHPGTGVVILSQFDDPAYAVALLAEGASGLAYLLKDRVAEGDQLARAVREVATGGSMLDPKIVAGLTRPVQEGWSLDPAEERLLVSMAEGMPIKAIAVAAKTTPADVEASIERLFVTLAEGIEQGEAAAVERLRVLHRAISDREEQGEQLIRLLPGGVAEKLVRTGRQPGDVDTLEVTVLMSDIRGYSAIAERSDPTALAGQLNEHRAAMNRAVIDNGGTVMQFVGDAVMAVFGAPEPIDEHGPLAVAAAAAMHDAQEAINARWEADGLDGFGLGIGLSTGKVAAALLGSEDRLEYSVVGDTVNLTQRLQQFAVAGQTVLSEPTAAAIGGPPSGAEPLGPTTVKGRSEPVTAWVYR